MDLTTTLQSGIPAAGTSALMLLGAIGSQKRPSRLSCVAFGSAFALGAFMIQDGDYKNGTGFISTWGLLYTMVNGKQIIKGAGLYGRVTALTALGVGALYGREFIRTPATNKEALLNETKAELAKQEQKKP